MIRMNRLSRSVATAALLGLASLGVGCGDKDGGIPTTPPLAPKEPYQILAHLKYLAVRKDLKHIVVIAPISPDVVFPSAWWFHVQATNLRIELSEQELKDLGIEKLKDRLTNLPRSEQPDYSIADARLAFNAGMYRLVKVIPEAVWSEMSVMEIKPNPGSPKVKDMLLGLHGKPILKVGCLEKSDGVYGVSIIQWQTRPEALKVK